MCRTRVCRNLEASRQVEVAKRTSKKQKLVGECPWEVEILPATPESLLSSHDETECSVCLSLTARFNPFAGLPLGKVVGEPGEALRVGAESLFIALQKVRCWQEPPLLCRATESSSCSHGAAERPLDDFRGLLGSTYFSSSKQKDARNPLPRSVEISVDHESWPIDERERELLEKAFDGASEKDARRKETMLRSKPKQRHSAPPSQTAQDGDVIEIGGGGSEQQAAGGPEEQEGEGSGMQDQTMGGQNVEGPGRGEQDVVWSERPRVGGPERQEVQG